jgi:hypothetical protein
LTPRHGIHFRFGAGIVHANHIIRTMAQRLAFKRSTPILNVIPSPESSDQLSAASRLSRLECLPEKVLTVCCRPDCFIASLFCGSS